MCLCVQVYIVVEELVGEKRRKKGKEREQPGQRGMEMGGRRKRVVKKGGKRNGEEKEGGGSKS